MYLQSKSSVESFRRKWTKKKLKPQLEQSWHKLLPLKLCILENEPKWLLVTTFGILKSGFVKREGKYGLLMHAFFLSCFLSSFTTFFFLCPLSLSFLLLSCRGLLLLSFMATSSFYSELIPWDFSLLPLELHQLFLVSCRHPFKTVNNPLVARPLPLLSTFSLYHYSFHNKISFCLILLQTSTSGFKWIRIWLPYHLPLWHASGGPSRLPHLLGKIPSQQNIFPKEALAGNQR